MKKITFALLVIIIGIYSSGFSCNKCEPPNCRRERVCDPWGNCEWRTVRRVGTNFDTVPNSPGEYIGIFDISKGWKPVEGMNAEAKIKLENASGEFVEQTFSLTPELNIAQTIDPIDKDTVPFTFVVSDPTAMNNFFNNSFAQNYDKDAEISLSVPVTQTNCELNSGTYINHTRLKDSSGITYTGSFSVIYTAPENLPACNQGTLVFED